MLQFPSASIFSNAPATFRPVFLRTGIALARLLNTSIHVSRYIDPSLCDEDRTRPPNRSDRGLRYHSSRSCDAETAVSSACVTCKNLVWPAILSQNGSLLRRKDADCSIRRNFRKISSWSTRPPCQKADHARRCFLRRLPRLRIVGEGDRIGDPVVVVAVSYTHLTLPTIYSV